MEILTAAQAPTKISVLGYDKYDDVREGLLYAYAINYVRSSVKTIHVRMCSRDCLCLWLILNCFSYSLGSMRLMWEHDSVISLPHDSTYSR